MFFGQAAIFASDVSSSEVREAGNARLEKSKELIMRAVKEGRYVPEKGGAYLMKVTDEKYIRVGVTNGEIRSAMPLDAKKAEKIIEKYY